jgi:HSP20 family molecular chaperone IbpA
MQRAENMNTRSSLLTLATAVVACLLLLTACSKKENEPASATSTPSITATPSSAAPSSPAASPTITPLPTGSPFADIQLQLRELESKLDNVFAESFHDFGTLFGPSTFGSSVDLREEKDKYVARVFPPNGDTSKVDAKIDNGALRITIRGTQATSGTTTSENYEQIISLPQPVRADQMRVDRKQNFVVMTIPKSTPAVAASSRAQLASPPAPTRPPGATADFDERMLSEIDQMQRRMNQIFEDTFPNDLLNGANMLRLSSTVNIEDQKDKYVVHFTLPNRNLNNVDVKFENGRLHLTAQEQKSASTQSASGKMETVENGRYEETIALPGSVKDSQMKVDRKGASIDVILPKA